MRKNLNLAIWFIVNLAILTYALGFHPTFKVNTDRTVTYTLLDKVITSAGYKVPERRIFALEADNGFYIERRVDIRTYNNFQPGMPVTYIEDRCTFSQYYYYGTPYDFDYISIIVLYIWASLSILIFLIVHRLNM